MPIQILMPALSPTMTEGNLVKWHKKEGDTIQAGVVIAEIETDKATMEVEAVDEGVLGRIMIPEGSEAVAVNTLIGWILEDGESIDSIPAENAPTPVTNGHTAPPTPAAAATSISKPALMTEAQAFDRVLASPLAKRIAKDQGLNLKGVQGTGPHGRIVKDDVLKASSHQSSAPAYLHPPLISGEPYKDIKLSSMRKTIASRLQESKQTIPHFYLTIDCKLDALLALRQTLNTWKEAKISVNDFVMKATAMALKAVPPMNATWHDTFVREYQAVDVCVAVATDGGLITPIVPNADQKGVMEISRTIKDLAIRAREGKLQPHEYQGGGFTVSNLGMFGIKHFEAIINPPQVAILAVGASEKRVHVGDTGAVETATFMTCTLSIDHRAVDGVVGAKFLDAFKKYIEMPALMVA